jgi:hypothetical protein
VPTSRSRRGNWAGGTTGIRAPDHAARPPRHPGIQGATPVARVDLSRPEQGLASCSPEKIGGLFGAPVDHATGADIDSRMAQHVRSAQRSQGPSRHVALGGARLCRHSETTPDDLVETLETFRYSVSPHVREFLRLLAARCDKLERRLAAIEDIAGWQETEPLLASPKNVERLAASIRKARIGGAREQLIGVDGEGIEFNHVRKSRTPDVPKRCPSYRPRPAQVSAPLPDYS